MLALLSLVLDKVAEVVEMFVVALSTFVTEELMVVGMSLVLDKVAEVVEMLVVEMLAESMVVGMRAHMQAPSHLQLDSLGCWLHCTMWSTRVEMVRKVL